MRLSGHRTSKRLEQPSVDTETRNTRVQRHELLGDVSDDHASVQPRADDQGCADPLLPGRRSSWIRRRRLHRPPRPDAPVVERRRPRRPRPVHRALLLRRRHRHDAPDPQHRRAALPQSVPGGEGVGHAGRAVRWALHARGRHRLHARGVQGAGRRLRATQRPVRRGHRGDPRGLESGRLRPRGLDLQREGTDGQPEAHAAPTHLDRWEQPPLPPTRGPLRRRLEPLSRPEDPRLHRQDPAPRVRRRPPPDARRALAVHGGSRPRPRQHRRVVRHRRRRQPGRRQLQSRRHAGRRRGTDGARRHVVGRRRARRFAGPRARVARALRLHRHQRRR